MEVGLIDVSVGERDLAVQRRRQAVADAALHLRLHHVGRDCDAAVDRAHHAIDRDLVAAHRNFRHLRHHRAEGLVHGDAASAPLLFREWRVPSGLLGRELERTDVARMLAEQRQPESDRVLSRRVRQLIDHHFLGERHVRVLD